MCSGYQRERIFITKQAKSEENVQTSTQKPLRSADARPSFARREKNDALRLTDNEQGTRASPARGTELQLRPAHDVSVRHAFRQQLLSEFIYSYMPDSTLVPLRPFRKDKGSWLVLVAALPELTTALESSVLAMSTAKIGRLKDDPVLVKASLKSYVQGLWELQKALWDPNLMYRDETLAACMALWMYEVMECPAGTVSGWISHFDGCQRLVQLRGAKAHSSTLGHQVFLAFRTTAVSSSRPALCFSTGPVKLGVLY
jgi:Fungal specific transcription factor domain